MIYCAATENGYESLSDKSIAVFFPVFGKNEKGEEVIIQAPTAKTADFISLAIAGIVAAYAMDDAEPPIDGKYILYKATPQERTNLLTAIAELRNQWYTVPKVVEKRIRRETGKSKQQADDPKNA